MSWDPELGCYVADVPVLVEQQPEIASYSAPIGELRKLLAMSRKPGSVRRRIRRLQRRSSSYQHVHVLMVKA